MPSSLKMEEESASKSSISLPSRYLEELDNCSSPGVVSKKAAYFEEAIRSASGEKKLNSGSLRRTGTGPRRIMDDAELSGMKDSTVRTLEFLSDSEGSGNEAENRPPEVNKLEAADDGVELQQHSKVASVEESKVVDGEADTSPDGTGELCEQDNETGTKLAGIDAGANETGELREFEVPEEEEIKVVVTGCSQLQFSSSPDTPEADATGVLDEKADTRLMSTSGRSDVSELRKEGIDGDREGLQQVRLPEKKKAAKPEQAQRKPSAPRSKDLLPQRAKAPQVKRGEAIRSSVSEFASKRSGSRSVNPVSKSTSFTTPQPFSLATEKRREASRAKQIDAGSKQASTSSRDAAPRRSVSEFHLKSEERAEKRKEFYQRLEERMCAKEQEKNQTRVKKQEVMNTELRKLRQSLTFKAKPMPSFYHESPQTKTELKKAAATHPISPKLGKPKKTSNKIDSPGSSTTHHHHNVRLCQQHHQKPSPGSVRSSGAGKLVVSPEKVSGSGKKAWNSPATRSNSGVAEKDSKSPDVVEECSIFDLKEEDETLLLAC